MTKDGEIIDLLADFLNKRKYEQQHGRPVIRAPIYVSPCGTYCYQILNGGRVLKVDVADAAYLAGYRWTAGAPNSGTNFYATTAVRRDDGSKTTLQLHRLIMRPPEGFVVDHANGDGLDNRRSNLRVATFQQNSWNTRAVSGQVKFKGVYYEPERKGKKKYRVQITLNGRRHKLGRYATAEEAARAYDRHAMAVFGQYAATNESLGLFNQRDGE